MILAATNGHILCEKKLEISNTGEGFTFILASRDVNNLLKILPKKTKGEPQIWLTYDSKKALFDVYEFQYACKEVDGKYPDYKKVIPETKTFLSLPSANSKYVISALNALGSGVAVDIGFSDSSSPFILSADSRPDTKCVVMPMRCDLSLENELNQKTGE